ncbi:hypothetical protein BVY00_00145, partial [bacterium G20]
QLAQRGRALPVTARGGGSNTSGAAIGSGLLLLFTAHMNKIVTLNTKRRFITLQPGIIYGALQQTLKSHGLFLPPYPASQDYATLGGSIASNAIGEKSVKYGSTGDYVQSLKVVLSNGEIIETGPLSKKELNHKLGLQSLEGEVYRLLDTMLEENAELIDRSRHQVKARHNAAGYNLFEVKKKGEFDLTPLLIGSQGTLGIITEATLDIAKYNPQTVLALISLEELRDLEDILPAILELKPSTLDMLSRAAIEQILALGPHQLSGVLARPQALLHLFVEFDDAKKATQMKKIKSLQKIAQKVGVWSEIYKDTDDQQRLRKLRDSVSTLMQPQGKSKAVPVAEDICVPPDKLAEFLVEVETVYSEVGLPASFWGQAGSGVVRMQPALDLSQTGDRQKLFKIQNGLYPAAVRLGGSISAAAGDGRIRAPYISLQYGEELHRLMLRIKEIFDPLGILNPGVKTATPEDVKNLMRSDYSLSNFYNHLPRS